MRLNRWILLVCAGLVPAVFAQSAPEPQSAAKGQIWFDASQPVEKRVDALVSAMTLDEKAAQMVNGAAAIPRLGVPAYDYWSEGLHGIARSGYATLFPQAIGLAATWDPTLQHQVATVISIEARAKYNQAMRDNLHSIFYGLTIWSPNINIFRDPRWGRGQETYGEDPFLTSQHGRGVRDGTAGRRSEVFPHHRDAEALRGAQRAGAAAARIQRECLAARSGRHLSAGVSGDGDGRTCRLRDVRVQRHRRRSCLCEYDAARSVSARRLEVPGICDLRLRSDLRISSRPPGTTIRRMQPTQVPPQ